MIIATALTKFSLLLFAKKATKGASKERLSKLEARDFDGVSADSKSRGQGRTRTFGFLLLALLLSNYFLLFGSSIGCSIMPIDVKFITKRKKKDHLDHWKHEYHLITLKGERSISCTLNQHLLSIRWNIWSRPILDEKIVMSKNGRSGKMPDNAHFASKIGPSMINLNRQHVWSKTG